MNRRREALARGPRFAVLASVALVGLLGLVAIGSAGHTPIAFGGRRPSYVVADAVVNLALAVLVIGAVVVAYALISEREYLVAQRLTKRRTGPLRAIATVLLLVLVLLVVRNVWHGRPGQQPQRPISPAVVRGNARTMATTYKPRFAPTPVLLVLGLAASVALAAYLAHRPRRLALRTPADKASVALTLADALGDTLDDLRAEPDPRRAVIAAYARLERTLGAFGLPRRAAEAPDEYVHRLFVDLGVNSRFARELTELFARAKFSQHRIDQPMKENAIQLLETIRAGLREDEHSGQRPTFESASSRASL